MRPMLGALGRYAVKIDHLAIAVPDLEASIELYRRMGFQLTDQRRTSGEKTEMISAVLSAGPIIVVLVQGSAPGSQVNRYLEAFGPGIQHIAIEVRDLDAVKRELVEAGVELSTTVIQGRGIRQLFTARDRESGMMYELIERQTNDGDFTDESVQELFRQLERNDAY